MGPLAARLKSWSARIHVCRIASPASRNSVEIISRCCFLPIAEEAIFTQLLDNPERFRSPATSYFEKHPTSSFSISQAQVYDTGVCSSRGCGNDPEHGKTVTG